MTERTDWIQTFTGRQFYPLAPLSSDVDIADIAHALARLCRFNGHCRSFYSVAEHSVLLSRAVAIEHKFWALMHDASEAYICDVVRPIKPHLPGYAALEDSVMAAVCRRYGLPAEMPADVKWADSAILADEMLQLMATPPAPWKLPYAPLGIRVQCWTPERAEAEFLEAFHWLTGYRNA